MYKQVSNLLFYLNRIIIKPSPLLPLPLERETTNRKCHPEFSLGSLTGAFR